MKPALYAAEEPQPIIVPTVARSKIPRSLSYPIGAEAISKAFSPAAQIAELKLVFYSSKFDVGVRSGRYELRRYEFIRVEYLHNAKAGEKWPISSLYGRPTQSRWEVVVQPVPRVLRHRINEYIVESALPMMADWLAERSQLLRQGSDLLAFFYDENAEEEFAARKLSSLEPTRTRAGRAKARS
jgi:hypothetical protein